MNKAAAVFAASAVTALILVASGRGLESTPEAEVDIAKTVKGKDIDTAAYSESVQAIRAANPMVVDLLSPELQPGDGADVGANFPFGARLTGELQLTTNGFTILKAECEDRPAQSDAGVGFTWCYVHVTNTGTEPRRAQLLVKYRLGE